MSANRRIILSFLSCWKNTWRPRWLIIIAICVSILVIATVKFLLSRVGSFDQSAHPIQMNAASGMELAAYLQSSSLTGFLTDFARTVTNSATITDWRSWAERCFLSAGGKAYDSAFFGGVAIKPEDMPAFIPHQSGIVGAAVVSPGKTNTHVRICWRGRDFFYDIVIGAHTLHPLALGITNGVKELGPGMFVCLEKGE